MDNKAQTIWLWDIGKHTVYRLNDWTTFSLITGYHFTEIFSHSFFAQLLINLLITFLVPLSMTIWWLAEKSQWSGPLLNARWDEASLSLSNCIFSRANQWHKEKSEVKLFYLSCPRIKDKWDRSKDNKPNYISGSLLSPENRRKYIETEI